MALVAGVLALQAWPSYAEQNIAPNSKYMLGATYRAATNVATYSHLGSIFTGEYRSIPSISDTPWLTSELADFLFHSPQVSFGSLDYLVAAIRNTYGNVRVDVAIHTDPEEGWTKPVIIVHSGVEDFDKLMDIEDGFFSKAASDPILLGLLPFVVVSQA